MTTEYSSLESGRICGAGNVFLKAVRPGYISMGRTGLRMFDSVVMLSIHLMFKETFIMTLMTCMQLYKNIRDRR